MKIFQCLGLIGLVLGLSGAGPVTSVQLNHATTNRTTSSWGTIVTSLSRDVNYVDIQTSATAGTLVMGLGAVGAEGTALYIQGSVAQSRTIPLFISKGRRVSLKALNATVNVGELILNFVE